MPRRLRADLRVTKHSVRVLRSQISDRLLSGENGCLHTCVWLRVTMFSFDHTFSTCPSLDWMRVYGYGYCLWYYNYTVVYQQQYKYRSTIHLHAAESYRVASTRTPRVPHIDAVNKHHLRTHYTTAPPRIPHVKRQVYWYHSTVPITYSSLIHTTPNTVQRAVDMCRRCRD